MSHLLLKKDQPHVNHGPGSLISQNGANGFID